uniref:Noggin-like protein 3 n=1 Tax=Schmidtea mediterranea TaxID=79327 RepID=C1JAC3_SCHMD|nr:noggin-like protein 3 [Schmidtea mediterranea]
MNLQIIFFLFLKFCNIKFTTEGKSKNKDFRKFSHYYEVPSYLHFPNITHNTRRILQQIIHNGILVDNWISITKPHQLYQSSNEPENVSKRMRFLVKMKNITLIDKNGFKINISKTILTSIQQWLIEESKCQVEYHWQELNETYWPRWVKKGLCVNIKSCSWPPGMSCSPNSYRKLSLLQWICAEDKSKEKYKDDKLLIKIARKIRRKRQNISNNSKFKSKKRWLRLPRKLEESQSNAIKIRLRLFKLSLYTEGFYCKWREVHYRVIQTCSCNCS